jgi:hypothetical protein
MLIPRYGSDMLNMDGIMDRDVGQTKALRYEEVNSDDLLGWRAAKPAAGQDRLGLAPPEAQGWTLEQWLRGLLVPVLEEPS